MEKEKLIQVIDNVVRRTMKMDFSWDWSAGVAFYGILRAYEVTGNDEYIEYLKSWVDEYIELGIPKMTVNALSIGYTILALYQKFGDEKYLEIFTSQIKHLKEEAERFGDGVLQHTVSQNYNFPEQAWADTLFMAGLLMVKGGFALGDDELVKDGLNQFHWHIEYLQNKENNLFYHAWNNIEKNNMSSIHWARANGWCAITMSEVLKLIDAFNPSFVEIKDCLRDQLAALVRMQSENGLWHTILDDDSSYEETSASCGIGCALVNYIELEQLVMYKKYVEKVINGVCSKITADGTVHDVSGGTAVMYDADGYKKIPKERIQGWGQGLALAFLCECVK